MNIFILARQSDPDLEQDDFRWSIVLQLVAKATELDDEIALADRTHGAHRRANNVPRCSGGTPTRFRGGLAGAPPPRHHSRIRRPRNSRSKPADCDT